MNYRALLKKLNDEIREAEARLARYRDQRGVSQEAKEAYADLQRLEMERLNLQRQMDQIDPTWGPNAETEFGQEIMDRYSRQGIEQRYPEAKEIVDHPAGHIVVNPDGSAREVRSPGGFNRDYPSQQMELFDEIDQRSRSPHDWD